MSFKVSDFTAVSFCNSCPNSSTVASKFIVKTYFFPLHVTDISLVFLSCSIFKSCKK
ncbi:hypothetical protein HanRHA438_Chr16g0746801 [Helianthus annuus]|nr:hypothetical protein HanRHA438_Chr16g0746801 [Helianthus annuus]